MHQIVVQPWGKRKTGKWRRERDGPPIGHWGINIGCIFGNRRRLGLFLPFLHFNWWHFRQHKCIWRRGRGRSIFFLSHKSIWR
jgi:hypothetical protein